MHTLQCMSPAFSSVKFFSFLLRLFNFLKVVHEVGLCITLFDITEISDSYILPGDGSAHTPGICFVL